MTSVKSLESRLTLTADPGPLIAGVKKAERSLSTLGTVASAFSATWVGSTALNLARSGMGAMMAQFERMRDLSLSYSGVAIGASARADVAEMRRDMAMGQAFGPGVAQLEAARERMAMYQQSQVSPQYGMPAGGGAALGGAAASGAWDYAGSRLGTPASAGHVMNPGGAFIIDFLNNLFGQGEAATTDTEILRDILEEQRKGNAARTSGGGG